MATGKEISRAELERLLMGVKTLSTRYGGQDTYSDPQINELSRAVGWMAEELLSLLENGLDSLREDGMTPPKTLWKRIERRFYRHHNSTTPEFEPTARQW